MEKDGCEQAELERRAPNERFDDLPRALVFLVGLGRTKRISVAPTFGSLGTVTVPLLLLTRIIQMSKKYLVSAQGSFANVRV